MARHIVTVLALLGLVPCAVAGPNLVGEVQYQIGTQVNEAGQLPVEFEIWVENVGDDGCAVGWWVDFWASYPCPCDEHPNSCMAKSTMAWASSDFGTLSPGQKLKMTPKVPTFWVTPGPNPLTYNLFVDSIFAWCEEDNEEDNFVCGNYTVSDSVLEADLTVDECTVTNSADDPADVILSVMVTNEGQSATMDETFVEFFFEESCNPEIPFGLDGEAFASVPAGLGPGEQFLAEATVGNLAAGNYSMAAVANGLKTIEEAEFSNNCCLLEPNPFVQAELKDKPDLQIIALEAKLASNNSVYYEGLVGNEGFVDIGPEEEHKICVWFNRNDEPPICAIPDVANGEGHIIAVPEVTTGGECLEDAHCQPCWACDGEQGLCVWDGVSLDCEYEFGRTIGFLPNGCYSVWARVDCDCVGGATGEIWETKEKNNDAKFDLCVDLPGPDLKIQMFMVSEDTEADYSKVKYFVQVSNEGTDPVEGFDLDIFFNSPVLPDFSQFAQFPTCEEGACDVGWYAEEEEEGDCICKPEGLYYFFDGVLDPGGKVSIPVPPVEMEWDPLGGVPAGEYRAWAVADIYNLVPETVEDNNYVFKDILVQGVQPGTPNLTVTSFIAPTIGNTTKYFIEAKNNGDKDIPASKTFRIDLFVDRDTQPDFMELGDYVQEVATGIKAGESVQWVKELEGMEDGEYHSYVVLDATNEHAEGNEGDNIAGPRIVVVCSQCHPCPEDSYITKACVCGEETVSGGYCCHGEWYAVGCPVEADGGLGDVAGQDATAMVEWFPPGGGNKTGDCACSFEHRENLSHSALWILMLLAFAWVRMRFRTE